MQCGLWPCDFREGLAPLWFCSRWDNNRSLSIVSTLLPALGDLYVYQNTNTLWYVFYGAMILHRRFKNNRQICMYLFVFWNDQLVKYLLTVKHMKKGQNYINTCLIIVTFRLNSTYHTITTAGYKSKYMLISVLSLHNYHSAVRQKWPVLMNSNKDMIEYLY